LNEQTARLIFGKGEIKFDQSGTEEIRGADTQVIDLKKSITAAI
jgi:hypothetical protein